MTCCVTWRPRPAGLTQGSAGLPYDSAIRFTGRRAGVTSRPSAADRFEQEEMVHLVPGSGPVAVTTRVADVNAGEWLVRARPGQERGIDPDRLLGGVRLRPVRKTMWPKGNPVAPAGPGASGPGRPRWRPRLGSSPAPGRGWSPLDWWRRWRCSWPCLPG